MSAELVHLACWALLVLMAVFLFFGGRASLREYRSLRGDHRGSEGSWRRARLNGAALSSC
jgi:hypothetical protein